ncbi:TlpA family protein disulfide reductase [Roseomonas arctica]|uniref:TlpA family protein disulfide reductase n=1 Tax=Plastoroseomonas arctica TaxID=1509237 RepID=A0AAF1JWD4_9PROT|nr:TlpA family protein disulfide reductase [Plastoroseomonas arctica]
MGATLAASLLPKQGRAAGGALRRGVQALPEFGFTDGDGVARRVADFGGQGLLLNFWATWCPPCVAEMPALDRLQAALKPEGFSVLALSSDRGGRAQVAPFYARVELSHLGIWLDPRGAAGRALSVRGLPTSVIVDREGREVARLEGAASWDAPDMVAAIRDLIGPAAARPATDRA